MRITCDHQRRDRGLPAGRTDADGVGAAVAVAGHAAAGRWGFFSYTLWDKARATGADLLWRIKSNAVLPVEKRYSDESFASIVYPGTKARRNKIDGIAVRVVEYTLQPGDTDPDAPERTYRLMTTITDPNEAPASELARIYTALGNRDRLRRTEDPSAQPRAGTAIENARRSDPEVYGYLCVHYAIRWLMHSAATDYGHDPDRLSFTRSLRAARRTTASHPGFSP